MSHEVIVVKDVVRSLLDEIATIKSIENKAYKSDLLFSYLLENEWFLDKYPKFKQTAKDKLIEFEPSIIYGFDSLKYQKIIDPDRYLERTANTPQK